MTSIPERPHRAGASVALLLCTSLLLSGCASLDPSADIAQAQQLTARHSGHPVDWQGPWHPDAIDWQAENELSADDAARLALRNHPGLRVSVESITEARAAYVQAHLLPNPVINFAYGFTLDGDPTNPIMSTLVQPLAGLWQQPARVDAADDRLRATVLSVSAAAITLVAEAEAAHTRLVFAERDLLLEEESRNLARESLTLTEGLLDQGEATMLDRNRIELELTDATTRGHDARQRRDRAHRDLLEVCGIADAAEMPRTDGQPLAIPDWVEELSERDLIIQAETQRLDLAASRALLQGAIDEADLAELRRIPDISLGVVYQRNYQGRDAVGPVLQMELPIFDDGRAEAATAESLARTALAESEAQRQAAIAELRDAWVRFVGERRNAAHLRDTVLALASHNRELAEQSLDAGVVDRGTMLELRRRELRTQVEVHGYELDAALAYIDLKRAAGGCLLPPPQAPLTAKAGEVQR